MPTTRVSSEAIGDVAGDAQVAPGGDAPPAGGFPEEALDRYRAELFAHCYRMTGSVHDAEDLVQETYLRAWRSFHTYEARSSLRTWLHRIATNVCLTALASRQRRPLPSGLGAEPADPRGELTTDGEVPWLEPVPDARVGAGPGAGDPAGVVAARESVRLAFVAALQHLPPRQRAVLLLRDVLAWRAAEVADLLGTSVAAVNSALQRARGQIEQLAATPEETREPESAELRALLDRYVSAFERYDVGGMVELFTADAVWEMPPFTGWYRGGEAITTLIAGNCPAQAAGDMRMVPTSANGQPAFGLYMRGADGVHRAFQLQVLDLAATADGVRVGHVVAFFDPGLFDRFGLPEALAD
ncbi:sigma-70 family RNA polymerase sigma factor [Kineococcus xinjiangensis]|uniref:sigma-70 family RNA polymerase sigma factor n=1 Tax=Kineococcus xinjiangensis TaxID=512762 RepID=UPI002481E4EC|nr:sigma-70 family RNA polymerase sigma factor [Kineococcus xinjiangensis]